MLIGSSSGVDVKRVEHIDRTETPAGRGGRKGRCDLTWQREAHQELMECPRAEGV